MIKNRIEKPKRKNHQPIAEHIMQPYLNFCFFMEMSSIPYYSDARVTKFHYRDVDYTNKKIVVFDRLGTPRMKATEAYVQVIYFEILNEKTGRDLQNFILKCTASQIHISQF